MEPSKSAKAPAKVYSCLYLLVLIFFRNFFHLDIQHEALCYWFLDCSSLIFPRLSSQQPRSALSVGSNLVIYLCLFSYHLVASVLPVEDIALWAHDVGAILLVDACQSVPHMVVDVQKLDADFLVASSHKVSVLPYFLKSYIMASISS